VGNLLRAALIYGFYVLVALTIIAAAAALVSAIVLAVGVPLLCFLSIRGQCRRICHPGPWTIASLVLDGTFSLLVGLAVTNAAGWSPFFALTVVGPAIFLVAGNLMLLILVYCKLHPHIVGRVAARARLRSGEAQEAKERRAVEAANARLRGIESTHGPSLRRWEALEAWVQQVMAVSPVALAPVRVRLERHYAAVPFQDIDHVALADVEGKAPGPRASLSVILGELEKHRRTIGPIRDHYLGCQEELSHRSAELAETRRRVAALRREDELAANRLKVAATPRIRLP